MKDQTRVMAGESGLVGVGTAVDRFSRRLDAGAVGGRGSAGLLYEDLIPLSAPGPGEQYAFEVDLDRCTGCKACVVACHSMNGLGETEWWREVGTLSGEREGEGWLQTITSACHHCLDPGCAEGCPVRAYEKDPATGVVRHLDDQCIGCRYCEMKCPYGVPKYQEDLGIVRKCDLCVGRLAAGEAPACVQACPGGAIRVRKVSVETFRAEDPTGRMVPTAFPSGYTRPTTRYVSSRGIAKEAHEVGKATSRAEEPHYPLVWMLGLTQMALGMECVALWLGMLGESGKALWVGRLAAGMLLAGLGGSVLHLGRPLGAWRFFLGLRTSWMSREILAFHVAVPAVLGSAWAGGDTARLVAIGLLGVAVWTSAMIYADTRRPGWSAGVVALDFVSSGVIAGGILGVCASGGGGGTAGVSHLLAGGALLALMAIGNAWVGTLVPEEVREFRHRVVPRARSIEAFLLGGGAMGLGGVFWTELDAVFWGILGVFTIGVNLWRRYVFFAGTPAPRMPTGGLKC